MKKCLLALLFISSNLWAYGIGYATFPLMTDKHLITGEFNSIMSEGGGVGIQARYSNRLNRLTMVDAGFGIAGGERSARYFAGIDYEIFPDYSGQPRLSTKIMFESAREFSTARNILSIAPTVSKGVNWGGNEFFPFLAIPTGLNLNSDNNSYQTYANLALGISGRLPFKDYSHLTGNVEVNFNLKDSYSGITLGISYTVD